MNEAEKAIGRFPNFLDARLYQGVETLAVNTSKDFLVTRSLAHLRHLLLTQFILQTKIEDFLKKNSSSQNPFFLKLFQRSSRFCLALTFSDSIGLYHGQLLKVFHSILPGIHEVPRSSFIWYHPELHYFFCYLEVHKMRGSDLSKNALCNVEKALQEHLLALSPLTPTLFWPYNEEESYRQIQLLQQEVRNESDLPHVSIHFQEQTSTSLEFLVHLVRPKSSDSVPRLLKRFPDFLESFCHFHQIHAVPLPIELGVFSLKVPSGAFDETGSINLLYARRYVLKYIEAVIGPLRDYNGGLFEKQQQHFERFRIRLSSQIPHFHLFAEKVFYAIHPVEARLSLSFKDAEDLFFAFSELMENKENFAIKTPSKDLMVIKTANKLDLHRYTRLNKKNKYFRGQLSLGGFYYLCILGPIAKQAFSQHQEFTQQLKKTKTLRLILQEGAPPSLNSSHAAGDMRCRVLSKLLFEGLTRLNTAGQPKLAGAIKVQRSKDKCTYVFKLRPHHWSNGEKVTAIDYVTSWQRSLKDPVSHPDFLFMIKNARLFKEKQCHPSKLGMKALDAETLQIELEFPDPHFLYKLAQPFFFPTFGSLREPKWFNGPYSVREQNKDGLLLEQNPYFWNKKRSFFKQIEILWNDDINAIHTHFKEGNVDWIGDPLSTLTCDLIKQLQQEFTLHKHHVNRCFSIFFNTHHPVLSSPFIRRALSKSIDRSFICKHIFPDSNPIPPLVSENEEAIFCLEKGLKQLGLNRKTFPPLTFIYSHQARREDLALYLQSSWEKVLGLKVRIEKHEWNIFRNKLEKKTFEICGTIHDHDEDSPEFLERFEGSGSFNFSQWRHSYYRDLIQKMKKNKKQNSLLLDAKMVLNEETPFAPLFTYTHLYAHNPQLEGCRFDLEGCIDFSGAFLKKRR